MDSDGSAWLSVTITSRRPWSVGVALARGTRDSPHPRRSSPPSPVAVGLLLLVLLEMDHASRFHSLEGKLPVAAAMNDADGPASRAPPLSRGNRRVGEPMGGKRGCGPLDRLILHEQLAAVFCSFFFVVRGKQKQRVSVGAIRNRACRMSFLC